MNIGTGQFTGGLIGIASAAAITLNFTGCGKTPTREYYENGKLKTEAFYKDGKPAELVKEYDASGKLMS